MNFPGGFVVFLFFLASEEQLPKLLKQVSTVGKIKENNKNDFSTEN